MTNLKLLILADGTCQFKAANVGATEVSCMDIERESKTNLQKAVAMEGPISVAIDAGHRSFQLYKTGVYKEPECSSVRLDHRVLAVGYGSDSGSDYWIVKTAEALHGVWKDSSRWPETIAICVVSLHKPRSQLYKSHDLKMTSFSFKYVHM